MFLMFNLGWKTAEYALWKIAFNCSAQLSTNFSIGFSPDGLLYLPGQSFNLARKYRVLLF